jgi:DNA-binding transcriptional ArsR family regulator
VTASGKSRPLRVVHRSHQDTSRLFALAFERFFQRVCYLRRALADGDLDLAIIAGAVAMVGVESSMRDPAFRRTFANLDAVVGVARQRGCNALSIAEATGLPRETVRRKMRRLVDMGVLVRRDGGGYVWQPGVLQSPAYTQLLQEVSNETLRLLNECLEEGIFSAESPHE